MPSSAPRAGSEPGALRHYLLAIHQIARNKGVARTKDIATVLKVSSPSVTNMLERLAAKGLVLYRPYQGARLSPEGEAMVKTLAARASIFMRFLKRIDVPEHLIEADARMLESGLSAHTLRQMERFVRFVDLFGDDPCFLAQFRRYCSGELGTDAGSPACSLKMMGAGVSVGSPAAAAPIRPPPSPPSPL